MTDPHIPRQWDPDTMTDAEIAAVMGHIAERFERAAHPPGPDPDAAAPPPRKNTPKPPAATEPKATGPATKP